MMLANEGNVRLTDWLKQGLPLAVVAFVMVTLLVPTFWPLYG